MDKKWQIKKDGKNARHGMVRKKEIMEKREDEAMDGDGVVNMKTHEKNKIMEYFACKIHIDVGPGKECIPMVSQR